MENASRALIIAGSVLIAIFIISLGVFVFNQASSNVSKDKLKSQAVKAHNSTFESYFGTDISSTEVKALLTNIRTNNSSAVSNKEPSIIAICFASIDTSSSSGKGIYSDEIDPGKMNKSTFNDKNFYTDIQSIINKLQARKTYTINVPNTKAFKQDKEGRTGFEKNSDAASIGTTGTAQDGSTGAYYSSGYIRLIYIIDNDNLGCSEPKLK